MEKYKLQDHCTVNTNRESDTFVGIQCKDGELCFNFPMGFPKSLDDEECRKDIILVLSSIANTVGREDSELLRDNGHAFVDGFPIQAYFYLISDFIEHGYYKETEVCFRKDKRGKIDWRKTINRIDPCFQSGNAIYLDYIVRKTTINEDEMITLIHKFCVYESFERVGWIFTDILPERPQIKYNQELFKVIITDKLNQTFNDEKRRLFTNMLSIICNERSIDSPKTFMYGTNRYEYVWERMIDSVFGIKNKERFFPRTHWKTQSGIHDNSCLEPDSIMIYGNDVYILDAKYYKYGLTDIPSDLPDSSSINKQITYGEYVASQDEFTDKYDKIYNAFIMPFSSDTQTYKECGIAYSDWKRGNMEYENIVGILVDLKRLIYIYKTNNRAEIPSLAEEILKAFKLCVHK